MDNQAFSFNSDAKYQTSRVFPAADLPSLIHPDIQVGTGSFQTQFPDEFQKLQQASTDKGQQRNCDAFWQKQVNFTVWCASTGCGVSVQDCLSADDPLMQSVPLP